MSYRITFVREGQHNSAKVVVLNRLTSVQDLYDLAGKKLRFTVRSLRLLDGPILDDTFFQLLSPGPFTLVCSSKASSPADPREPMLVRDHTGDTRETVEAAVSCSSSAAATNEVNVFVEGPTSMEQPASSVGLNSSVHHQTGACESTLERGAANVLGNFPAGCALDPVSHTGQCTSPEQHVGSTHDYNQGSIQLGTTSSPYYSDAALLPPVESDSEATPDGQHAERDCDGQENLSHERHPSVTRSTGHNLPASGTAGPPGHTSSTLDSQKERECCTTTGKLPAGSTAGPPGRSSGTLDSKGERERSATTGKLPAGSTAGQSGHSSSTLDSQEERERAATLGWLALRSQPGATVTVIAQKSMVEMGAVKQLEEVARKFPSVRVAVGMPDLHPGPQFPIGAAFAVQGQVMPCLVGNDIGCGMSLFPTPIKGVTSKKAQKWAAQLPSMDRKWEGDTTAWLRERGLDPTDFDHELGTVGGGNHFAELQVVEEVCDTEAFEKLGLQANSTYLLVHSGSRALGQHVLKQHLDAHGTRPLSDSTPACESYLSQHDSAVAWAASNRRLIAHRFLSCLGCDAERVRPLQPLIDVCHNSVVKKSGWVSDGREETLWLHRKGAAPIDLGPVVIPGSRGAYSFIVAPGEDEAKLREAAYSVAHGAGRKWSRSHAEGVGKSRFPNPRALCTTQFGGAVVCDDTSLLYQEQPDAYKEITDIIADLEEHGAAKVVAVMRPVLTYKTRSYVPHR